MNENLSFNNKLSTLLFVIGWLFLNFEPKKKQNKQNCEKKSENCRRFGYLFLFLFVLVSSKPLVSLRRKKNTGMRLERRNTQTQTQKISNILNISLVFFLFEARIWSRNFHFFFFIEKGKNFSFVCFFLFSPRIFCVCANRCSIYKMFVRMLSSCPSTNQLKNPKNFFFQNNSSILLLLEPNNNHMSLSLSLCVCVCPWPFHFI